MELKPHQIIGHGVDITHVSRIAALLVDHRDRFIERTFTPVEQAECVGKQREAQRLASRFAAKEAVVKAMGTGLTHGMAWNEIGIATEPSGRPTIALTGAAAQHALSLGINLWHVSLTDTDEVAMASVIAIKELPACLPARSDG